MTTLLVSKLDAARRQLEAALALFFREGDVVALHTLASAANNILRDLNKAAGVNRQMLKDRMIASAVPGAEKQVADLLNEADNFFKHADRDSGATLRFNPKQTETLLFDSVNEYRQLTGETPMTFKVFNMWFMLEHPNMFRSPVKEKLEAASQQNRAYGHESRGEWFRLTRTALEHLESGGGGA
ncbi:MAG: hypothetical protein ACT4PU_11665 [Planctomycetota bacterium]